MGRLGCNQVVAALAGALFLGRRMDSNLTPANIPFVILGTGLLWFGWFGFNGGSELVVSNIEEANAVALIFVNTNTAAAAGLVAALLTAKLMFKKSDLTMALNGALAGLVAITAEPLTPSPAMALVIGAIGGVIVVFSILTLDKLKIDDPVGAISVHGTVGIWGLLVAPVTNSDAAFSSQLIGAGVIFGFVVVASIGTWAIIRASGGLRVTEEDEYRGVDVAECGHEAYPEFTSGAK